MNESTNEAAVNLGQRLLTSFAGNSERNSIASVMTFLSSVSGETTALMERLKTETDTIINGALNRQLNLNRDFLNQLSQFLSGIQISDTEDDEEEDDLDGEDDDASSLQTSTLAATTAFRRALRAHAKASKSNRAVRRTSTNGQIIKWLGNRGLTADELPRIGASLSIQDATRHFVNPVRRYIKGMHAVSIS